MTVAVVTLARSEARNAAAFLASDRAGELVLFSTGFLGLWAFPMYVLVDTGNPVWISVAFSVGLVAWSATHGSMDAFFSELFGTRVRYSGASLSYALAGVFGAVAPLVATRLLTLTGASWSVSAYIFALALVSFTATLLLSETHETDLSETSAEERQLIAEGPAAS